MRSILRAEASVTLPEFTGEKAYMISFRKAEKLPEKYERWQKTVDAMLHTVETDDTVFLTIYQTTVDKGDRQRRGGAHIDGCYSLSAGWGSGGWGGFTEDSGGGIILASDQIGCLAYEGEYEGQIGEGGDCSALDLSKMKTRILQPNKVYVGNAAMVHETIPAAEAYARTFVRLTLPESYH